MKQTLSLLLIVLFVSVAAQAQSKQEKEVADAVETLRTAMVDADEAALKNITADVLSYGHSSGKIEDKNAFVEALVSGTSDFKNMNLTEQSVTVADNTALVRHKLSADVVDSGKPNSINLGVLLVWQKQQGKWKLLARQAFKL